MYYGLILLCKYLMSHTVIFDIRLYVYDTLHILLSCDNLRDLWYAYMYVCVCVWYAEVKNALAKSVCCVSKCTICSLAAEAIIDTWNNVWPSEVVLNIMLYDGTPARSYTLCGQLHQNLVSMLAIWKSTHTHWRMDKYVYKFYLCIFLYLMRNKCIIGKTIY
jgi:hypothetical protein